MWKLSINSKIVLVLLLTGLACLATGGVTGYRAGEEALQQSIEQRLTAQRELKRQRVYAYIQNQLRYTAAVATAPETIEATKAFIAAFRAMRPLVAADSAAQKSDREILETWYREQFAPQLDKITGSHEPVDALMPTDPVARRLQADYIARNSFPVGEKRKLAAAPAGSPYDIAHARYHPVLENFAETVGFYDINIMDPETGDVVYTVAKETDFANNMVRGNYTQSGFARAAQRALDPRNGGKPVVEDFTPYPPSFLAPQMFAAMPIVADGQTIAVFIAQIDIKTLNGLINDDGNWRSTGQGDTGEVLLVGEDRLMRSQSRFMEEAPEKFLAQAQAEGLPAATANQIANLGTTILYMPTRTEAIERAFHNQTGFAYYNDYRGAPVVSAYGPLQVAGLQWAIEAKQDVAEAMGPAVRLQSQLLAAAAVAAILLTFLALACSAAFLRPLRRILAAMASMRASGAIAHVPVVGSDEFVDLARGYNEMADAIDERDQRLAAADRERAGLLRKLYPERFAERIRSGADTAAETVSNVTVVVALMGGLEPAGAALPATETRDRLDRLLEIMKTSAAAHGLEPVRSLGESYVAVCGLSTPQLDHAARALAWAQSVSDALAGMAEEWAKQITLRFGAASGALDVLLLSSGVAAYDVWGRTFSVARLIAEEGEPRTICVAESTYRLLPEVKGFSSRPLMENPALGSVATWARLASEPAAAAEAAQ